LQGVPAYKTVTEELEKVTKELEKVKKKYIQLKRKGKKFLGVNCGTNDAKVVTLTSTDLSGKRTYKCACRDTISSGASHMNCAVHYWECPA